MPDEGFPHKLETRRQLLNWPQEPNQDGRHVEGASEEKELQRHGRLACFGRLQAGRAHVAQRPELSGGGAY